MSRLILPTDPFADDETTTEIEQAKEVLADPSATAEDLEAVRLGSLERTKRATAEMSRSRRQLIRYSASIEVEAEARLRMDQLLDHPGITPEILEAMAQDPSIEVRYKVAAHPLTPSPVLELLASVEESQMHLDGPRWSMVGGAQIFDRDSEIFHEDVAVAARNNLADR